MVASSKNNLYGFPQPLSRVFPAPIVAQRAPTTSDIAYPPGQVWDDQAGGNIYFLVEVVGGSAVWELAAGTNAYSVTPWVVGPVGTAGYQTIQSAITAASAAQVATGNEQVVWIRSGTYTENLTLADGVNLIGDGSISQGPGDGVTVVGVHTPPTSGHIVLRNMYWQSATSILSSNAAGTCHIHFIDTESGVTDGWLFNLPNWTGILEIENYNPGTGATNDGGINNTGGSPILLFNAGLGWGTTRTCTISGFCLMESGEFNCPMNFVTGAEIDIEWITFRNTITLSNDSFGLFNFCSFITNAGAPITMSSSGNIAITQSTINTSNNPAIAGAGAGVLTLADIAFQNNNALAATLTLSSADLQCSSAFRTNSLTTGSTLSSSTWAATGSNTNISMAITPKGSGEIQLNGPVQTNITFAQSPVLQSSATTGAAPSGATGAVNLMALQEGEIMEQFILGAGQTIIAPRMSTTGLLTSLDLVATEGAEYNWGMRANALHTFTIGTSPAFFLELQVSAADIGGLDPLLAGFRIVQANDATLANYTDFAGIGANATTAADVVIIQTQLNTGGVVITNTTDAWTDGQTRTFRINVSAAGVVTYLINGVAPTVTAAFTFDTGDVVAPFIRHLFGATNPGAINWISMRVGLQ